MESQVLTSAFERIDKTLFTPFASKTVVVTGATGLIGSLACRAFAYANDRFGLDIKVIGIVRSIGKARGLFGTALSSTVAFAEQDLSEVNCPDIACDYILHAASITKSKLMVSQPVAVMDTSVNGTRSMLDLARKNRARMVFISSMEFYGSLSEGQVADEGALGYLDISSARSCYPESKRFCECLCNSFASQFNVSVCTARLAQTFGAGVLPGENRAFFQFARSATQGRDIVLKTKGFSEGNYVNSIDCIAALLLLLAKGESGQAYNVANEESHGTIREVAELAIHALGGKESHVVIDEDISNSSGYAPDVHLRLSSAKLRALGWEPLYCLEASFQQLADYSNEQDLFEI